jgi:hypothetical protein
MKPTSYKKLFTSLIIFILFAVNSFSQTPQYYNYNNVGSSNNSFPFNAAAGKAVNWLFLAGDFNQPAPIPPGQQITTVYFFTLTGGTRTFTDLRILMAQDTIISLPTSAFYTGTYDTVYYNPSATLTGPANGWMSVTLNHPFPYDPAKSLILFVGQCGATGSGITVRQNTLTPVRRVYSVGGCPFVASGGDGPIVNFGVDVVPAGPPAPILVFPPNNAMGISPSLTFVWNKPAPAITNFWWQLTTDTSTLTNLQSDSTLTDSTKAVTGLSNLTNYFWRVKSKNASGWGSFSGWFRFKTESVIYYNANTTGNGNSFPFNQPLGKMVQFLIAAGEINQPSPAPGGYITKLSVMMAANLGPYTYSSFYILLGQTTLTSFTTGAFYTGPMDTVYKRTSVSLTGTTGQWLSFPLDVPYLFNPAQGLVIQIEQCGAPGATGFSLAHTNITGSVRRLFSLTNSPCPWGYQSSGNSAVNCGINVNPLTGIEPIGLSPKEYKLSQNYPNPFNPITKISYTLPKSGFVTLKVYDLLGKEVMTLVNENKLPGNYFVDFNGSSLPSGTYFYKLIVNGFIDTKKMVLIK